MLLNPCIWSIGVWCLTSLLAIFEIYHGGQFYRWRKQKYPEKTTDLSQFIWFIRKAINQMHKKCHKSIVQWNLGKASPCEQRIIRMSTDPLYEVLCVSYISRQGIQIWLQLFTISSIILFICHIISHRHIQVNCQYGHRWFKRITRVQNMDIGYKIRLKYHQSLEHKI